MCIHQTGTGLLQAARARGVTPLQRALDVYRAPKATLGHYVVAPGGAIHQLAPDEARAPHAGVPAQERRAYLSGRWTERVPGPVLARWIERNAPIRSPAHLYPHHRSPNDAYVGIELIPARPRAQDRFSGAQYRALASLVAHLARKHKLSLEQPGVLVGHEDIEPLTRWNRRGGWDPGALRERPWFRWSRLHRLLRGRTGSPFRDE